MEAAPALFGFIQLADFWDEHLISERCDTIHHPLSIHMTSAQRKQQHYWELLSSREAANEGDISRAALSSTRLFILIGWLSHREFICVTSEQTSRGYCSNFFVEASMRMQTCSDNNATESKTSSRKEKADELDLLLVGFSSSFRCIGCAHKKQNKQNENTTTKQSKTKILIHQQWTRNY